VSVDGLGESCRFFEPIRRCDDHDIDRPMRTPDDIHDEWLVLRCQEGDASALTELVDRWQPRLLRFAVRSTGEADEAADVVQAAWLAILPGLNKLGDPACFRRWAYQIVTHKCADWVRARQQGRARNVPLATDPSEPKRSPDESHDEVAMVRTALRQLPLERRTILAMFYVDGMTVAEIAEALAAPVGTVKSRLHYARIELKELLERRKI
jgi:RNA polymerase sigma-70 factor (ECF subfamily)